MKEKKEPSVYFRPGYRLFVPVRSIEIWPFFTSTSNILNDSSIVKVNSTYNVNQLLVNTNIVSYEGK